MLVFNQEPLEEYDIAFQDDLQKEIFLKIKYKWIFVHFKQLEISMIALKWQKSTVTEIILNKLYNILIIISFDWRKVIVKIDFLF